MLKKAGWLWRRLSVMSASEIASRIQDQWFLLRLRRHHRPPPAAFPQEPPGSSAKPEFAVANVTFDGAQLARDYPMLLEGQLHYGGGDWQFDEGPQTWHREHTSLQDWPQLFFNAIDYRPGNPTGDARRSWEPARLQQLVALAVRASDVGMAQSQADTALAMTMIERQLASWWTHNPMLHGVHYVSAMECGLRCVSLAHMAALLEDRGRLSASVRAIVLATLAQHARFIRKRISTHSSAGNHTLAECAGLIYAALLLPDDPESAGDERFAVDLFVHEFDRQVASDGGGLEQATWYHRFNVELAECVAGTLAANQREVPDVLQRAIDRGSRFLAALLTGTELVRLGDADDGYALSPYMQGRWRTCVEEQSVQQFDETGVTCLRFHGWQLTVQHGPLGMPPSFGHGHADALSLVASIDGQEILCDSGTGAYSGDCSRRREHFRSCAAHNTVQVGDLDFARMISPFMWAEPYTCRALALEQSGTTIELAMRLTVSASTHGFCVERYLQLTPTTLSVADRITRSGGEAARPVCQRWHLAVPLEAQHPGRYVSVGAKPFVLTLAGGDAASVGAEAAQVSPAYGELKPVTLVSQRVENTPLTPASEERADRPRNEKGNETWLFMRLERPGSSASGQTTWPTDTESSISTDQVALTERAREMFNE